MKTFQKFFFLFSCKIFWTLLALFFAGELSKVLTNEMWWYNINCILSNIFNDSMSMDFKDLLFFIRLQHSTCFCWLSSFAAYVSSSSSSSVFFCFVFGKFMNDTMNDIVAQTHTKSWSMSIFDILFFFFTLSTACNSNEYFLFSCI